ncbi:MAG TPA: adenylate/guanylate cyclase domain-containing protein [Acidimicrobiia bacterium]|nr:adenylate/guanylate cyclase domain-containing protein [Acidimicrobiia bacterium]
MLTNEEGNDLTADELAVETGSSPDRIAELTNAGIVRPHEDGGYTVGDVQRVLVANALDEAGLSVELMRRGIEAGIVSFEDTDLLYPHPGRLNGSVDEVALEIGIATETLLDIITALGIPRPDPDTKLHDPDVEHLRSFVEAWQPLGGDDVLVRAARGYGEALRRAAESWIGIFEDVVLASLADRALPWQEMRGLTLEPGMRVLGAGRSLLPWLLDQHLFQLLNRLNFESIERQLAILGIALPVPRQPSAVVFADLTGFTRLTEERGDEVAAASAMRLATVAGETARRHGGRLVKLLGDGVMMHFPRPGNAVAAALELREAMEPAALPPVHVGIDAGPVLRRESDFFGRTVNIASRLAGVAGPDEILVTDDLAAAISSDDAPRPNLTSLSPIELKGVPEPVNVHRINR